MQFLHKYRLWVAGLAALILIAVLAVAAWDTFHPLPEMTEFKSRYFSFEYPRVYNAEEYAPGVVSIGHKNDEGLDPVVEVTRYQSDPDTAAPKTFDLFVKSQATALCGADGPAESISCTKVATTSYTGPLGAVGQELTLTLVRKNLKTSTTTEQVYGPMYVFNTTSNAKPTMEDPLRYSAIFVYPALSAYLDGVDSTELTKKVLDTLTVGVASSTAAK